jgi:hypothetical protein
MPTLDELTREVTAMGEVLDKRIAEHERLDAYVSGDGSIPDLISEARLTKLYSYLLPKAEAPWGSLVVDSKQDRLEVAGLRDTDNEETAEAVWAEWQANGMDSESKLGHGAALLEGRCYATVWPTEAGGADIALDDATQMVVRFAEGSRRHRVAALRRWKDGDRIMATLYHADYIYKFSAQGGRAGTRNLEWQPRNVDGEDWPLENRLAEVPVVEVAVNRRLKPGAYPWARGEFAHCTGLIDRINLLTFLGLVVAVWQGFPIRGIIGERIRREILRDDDGNPILGDDDKPQTKRVPPFEAKPDSIAQIENPDAKTFEFTGADRKNLSVFAELDHLATITKTPRHYFPLEQGMSNIAADTIRANEGAMHAAVTNHKATIGEGWLDSSRLIARAIGRELTPYAAIKWMDHSSRSLAERADAFTKLASSLPWPAAAEIALNVGDDQIRRWQAEQAMSPLVTLLNEAQAAAPAMAEPGEPMMAASGNGDTPS